ncbi:MAG TPA: hypothetical protein EYO59_13135, partial [Chromatiaceae bacterium]|nr:hypothetical protein [Chromatiaceae bacterium]
MNDTKQFTGRSEAEAAIQACQYYGITRDDIKYELVSSTGEGIQRSVVISVTSEHTKSATPKPREPRTPREPRAPREPTKTTYKSSAKKLDTDLEHENVNQVLDIPTYDTEHKQPEKYVP